MELEEGKAGVMQTAMVLQRLMISARLEKNKDLWLRLERPEHGRFRGNVLRSVVILGGDDPEKSVRPAATQPRIGQRHS